MNAHPPSRLQILAILLFCIAVFIYGLLRPEHNWDLIGYVAATHSLQGLRGESLHQRTFEDIQASVGEKKFQSLTNPASPYRAEVHRSSEALEQQLPFYRIRPVYLGLIQLAEYAGLDLVTATHAVNAAAAAVSLALLAVLAGQWGLHLLWVPAVGLYAGLADLARLSSPDALAVLGALGFLVTWQRRSLWCLLLLAALPLLRTDYLLLSLVAAPMCWLAVSRPLTVAAVLAAAIAFLITNGVADNYGYLTIFNFSLIERTPYPADMVLSHHWWDYVSAYGHGLAELLQSRHLPLYVIGFVLLAPQLRAFSDVDTQEQAALVALGFAGALFILFPAYIDRFYVFSTSVLGLYAIARWRERRYSQTCPAP